MMRVAIPVLVAAFVTSAVASTLAQTSATQHVVLEAQSASRALDAVPAVFAVAQNLEGFEIDVSVESMLSGFGDLAGEAAAGDQLVAALGAYGFQGYSEWAATIRQIFAVYAYVRSEGPSAPIVDHAVRQVLSDPGMPQRQRDAIASQMAALTAGASRPEGPAPSQQDLIVVIALVPHIESTIEMIQSMQ